MNIFIFDKRLNLFFSVTFRRVNTVEIYSFRRVNTVEIYSLFFYLSSSLLKYIVGMLGFIILLAVL